MTRSAVFALAWVAACHGPAAPEPVDLGSFRAELEGRGDHWEGNAIYGTCLNTAHIFFITQSTPKARITIHPMGAAAIGRHPFRPLNLIQGDAAVEPPLTGPYSLEIVIPPDTVFEADSGSIELKFDDAGRLRGTMEAWVRGKGGMVPHRISLPQRRFTGCFTAVRDRSLEPALTYGTECARD